MNRVYKIQNTKLGFYYIGFTTNKYLCNRLAQHKWCARNKQEGLIHRTIKQFDDNNWKITEIKSFNDKEQGEKYEQNLIDKHKKYLYCLNENKKEGN